MVQSSSSGPLIQQYELQNKEIFPVILQYNQNTNITEIVAEFINNFPTRTPTSYLNRTASTGGRTLSYDAFTSRANIEPTSRTMLGSQHQVDASALTSHATVGSQRWADALARRRVRRLGANVGPMHRHRRIAYPSYVNRRRRVADAWPMCGRCKVAHHNIGNSL